MWDRLKDMSFKLFSGPLSLDPFVPYFESIKGDLQKASMPFSLNEYVYVMFFSTLLVFVFNFPLLAFLAGIIFKVPLLAFLFSLTGASFLTLAIFFIFYTYPSFIAGRRRKEIEGTLSFSTTYMATIASSGSPPTTMFKVLSQFGEYGEISRESKRIYRDVEVFGMNLTEAMRKAASRTPSPQLKELLWGLINVLTTGSNPGKYLHEKATGFMQDNRRRLRDFSQTLSLLIEVYLTLIMVGSIFFVIMTSMMSIFGGGQSSLFIVFLQFLDVFIILPLLSIAFIIVLKAVYPVAV